MTHAFTLEELTEMAHVLETVSRAPGLATTRAGRCASIAGKARRALALLDPGPPVFTITLPFEVTLARTSKKGRVLKPVNLILAPRLNEYAAMMPWTLTLVREELDQRIEARKALFPTWDCGSTRTITDERRGKTIVKKLASEGGRRRIVRVTRRSSREVDELAVDILGGKLPVDRLYWAGIIAGDARKHIVRDGRWERAKPGHGELVVEVFEAPRELDSV